LNLGLYTRRTLYRAGRASNYIVLYRVSEEAVTILHVRHARQQWP